MLGAPAGSVRLGHGRPARRASRAAPIALAALAALVAPARADDLAGDPIGARAICHAGADLVGADGAAALAGNPAGLARSEAWRVELGSAVVDDELEFRAAGRPDSPAVADRGGPHARPAAAMVGPLGPLTVGLAYYEGLRRDRTLPAPEVGQPPADVARLFPHRYGGIESHLRRRTVAAGAALRATEWLGLGLSLTASTVDLGQRRRVWAGFTGRDPLGAPERDLDLAIAASDRLVLGGAASVLVAPPTWPIELAAGAALSDDAYLAGDAALAATQAAPFPRPETVAGRARLRLPFPIALRAGARYLGEHLTVEVDGELALAHGDPAPAVRLDGLHAVDQTGTRGRLAEVPALLPQASHGAVRVAGELEVVRGLIWLTCGYGFSSGPNPTAALAPGGGELASHTVALGAEARWNDLGFVLGYARSFGLATTVDPAAAEVVGSNPFGAGSPVAAAGHYASARDQLALSLEIAWP